MKFDTNPSIIFGLYCKPDKYSLLLERLKELKVGVRELRFIDVEIPVERKDEILNFFKEFILVDYWKARHPLNFLDKKIFGMNIKEKIEQNLPMNYKWVDIRNADWKNRKRHDLLWCLAVPLLYQHQEVHTETKEEVEAINDLATFKSLGYKDDETLIKEDIDAQIKAELNTHEVEENK